MTSGLIPPLLAGFAGTIALAFITGLELHAYRRRDNGQSVQIALGFGTTRTITLIAASGFVLWSLAPVVPFCVGLAVLGGLLALDYRQKLAAGDASLLVSVIGVLAFLLGPFVLTAPVPVTAALVVVILFALGEQNWIRRFSDAFPAEEGVTLGKFLLLAGLVLPLLPDSDVLGLAGITYTKVWTAVLLISGISYLGYLTHRYLFPRAGTLLTGVLGGLYSSTAATVVLARAARAEPEQAGLAPAAVIIATAMMYARLLAVITLLGHIDAARALLIPFGGFFVVSLVLAFLLARRAKPDNPAAASHPPVSKNPLDLPIAFVFAGLFVAFAAITNFVTARFGAGGLHVLSFAVGFSDIDPFILSLLDGKFQVSEAATVTAVLIASGSNNLLKASYAVILSRQRAMLAAAGWLALTLLLSLLYSHLAA
jgi:uncharacterized membrane protein (DUF4010 family)